MIYLHLVTKKLFFILFFKTFNNIRLIIFINAWIQSPIMYKLTQSNQITIQLFYHTTVCIYNKIIQWYF